MVHYDNDKKQIIIEIEKESVLSPGDYIEDLYNHLCYLIAGYDRDYEYQNVINTLEFMQELLPNAEQLNKGIM